MIGRNDLCHEGLVREGLVAPAFPPDDRTLATLGARGDQLVWNAARAGNRARRGAGP